MKARLVQIFCALFAASVCDAALIIIHPKNGPALEVDLVRVTQEGVVWRLNESDPNLQTWNHERIRTVEFPQTESWILAMRDFQNRDWEAALEKFEAVSKDRRNQYYPAPGNFSSLAVRRMLDCHRQLLNAERVAVFLEHVKKEVLPPDEMEFASVFDCWTAAGNQKWDELHTLLDGEAVDDGLAPEALEVAWLRAQAFEGQGQLEPALDEYSKIYTLSLGSGGEMVKRSLRRSAEILNQMAEEDRRPELAAQVKVFSRIYGGGQLWEGASADLAAAAEGDLEALKVSPASSGPSAADLEVSVDIFGRSGGVSPQGGIQKSDTGWVFDGADDALRLPDAAPNLELVGKAVKLRLVATPETENGVILDHFGNDVGLAVFVTGGLLRVVWKTGPEETTRKANNLGPVAVGEEFTLEIQFAENRRRITMNGSVAANDASSNLATAETGEAFSIGAAEGQCPGFSPDEHPRFQGTIRQFFYGTADTLEEME